MDHCSPSTLNICLLIELHTPYYCAMYLIAVDIRFFYYIADYIDQRKYLDGQRTRTYPLRPHGAQPSSHIRFSVQVMERQQWPRGSMIGTLAVAQAAKSGPPTQPGLR